MQYSTCVDCQSTHVGRETIDVRRRGRRRGKFSCENKTRRSTGAAKDLLEESRSFPGRNGAWFGGTRKLKEEGKTFFVGGWLWLEVQGVVGCHKPECTHAFVDSFETEGDVTQRDNHARGSEVEDEKIPPSRMLIALLIQFGLKSDYVGIV